MGIATLEDLQGSTEVVIFPKTFEETAGIWTDDAILLVAGRVDHKGEETVLLADSVWTWEQVQALGPGRLRTCGRGRRARASRASPGGQWQRRNGSGTACQRVARPPKREWSGALQRWSARDQCPDRRPRRPGRPCPSARRCRLRWAARRAGARRNRSPSRWNPRPHGAARVALARRRGHGLHRCRGPAGVTGGSPGAAPMRAMPSAPRPVPLEPVGDLPGPPSLDGPRARRRATSRPGRRRRARRSPARSRPPRRRCPRLRTRCCTSGSAVRPRIGSWRRSGPFARYSPTIPARPASCSTSRSVGSGAGDAAADGCRLRRRTAGGRAPAAGNHGGARSSLSPGGAAPGG